jgi:light-regulated signal transduction histidine kinase (bacteriophytochrome)
MEKKTTIQELEDKNKCLEELLLIVTHDLRAPVVNIESILNMLNNQDCILDKGKPLFKKAIDQLALMSNKLRSIQQVVSLKSYVNNQKEEIFFSDIVKTIKTEYSQEIEASKAVLNVDFSTMPSVIYDPIQFSTIFCNLISNAIKYRHPEKNLEINIIAKKDKELSVIKVQDNGLGFETKESSNNIFSLFKRMHTHVDGLGVGLHLVHTIVTNNGGKISVKSEVNKGTEFEIIL